MAKYQNITGSKLVVTDELGLIISFEENEVKEASNYLERYTAVYQSDENILLKRIGCLESGVPIAGIEEENIAVRPSASNSATIVSGPAADADNDAVRLRRIVLDTELDEKKRQIDTRYLSVKSALTAQSTDVEGNVDISGGSVTMAIDDAPLSRTGRRITQTDVANPIYNSLLTVGECYKLWGLIQVTDGVPATYNIGFAVTPDGTFTATDPGGAVTLDADSCAWNSATQEITFVFDGITGGEEADITINYMATLNTGAKVVAQYNADDELRGWYSATDAEAQAYAEASPFNSSVSLMLLNDDGVMEMPDGEVPLFTSW